MENLKLVKNTKKNKVFDLTQYASRDGYDPVRGIGVQEYQIPLDKITRTPKAGQVRLQDCNEGSVIQLADQMAGSMGLKTGICVMKGSDEFRIAWGNHRYRAAQSLDSQGRKIDNCEKGHIWACMYEPSSLTDLKMLQAKENNIHERAVPATFDDNVSAINDMIRNGHIKDYEAKDQREQKKEVKALYNKCHMPPKDFERMWRRIRKTDPATRQKMRTWDKHELSVYFGRNNNYGIKDCDKETTSGTVFEVDSDDFTGKLGIYLVTKVSEFSGATLSNAHTKRNIAKDCTRIVIVCSLNTATTPATLEKQRKRAIEFIEKWNPSVTAGKSVDEILFVPQSESEQEKQLISGQYPKEHTFEAATQNEQPSV